jgi:DNA polymerase-1
MESQGGMPFTGPSGKLLDLVLGYHHIPRGTAFLTNVCLCRPPDNRTPTPLEVRCCAPRLEKELAQSGAPQVLALGATASQAVLRTRESITSLRVGPPRRGALGLPDAAVVATFHPAACLRSADYFPHLQNDVGKLRTELSIGWEAPKFKVYDDVDSAVRVLEHLHRKEFDPLVIDIEVGIEKDIAFEHAERFQFLCIGIGYDAHHACVIGEKALRDPNVRSAMRSLLKNKRWIAHNGKFDLAGLKPIFGEGTLYFDTMLASYCLDERPGTHGLKYLAVELLGSPKYDDELRKYVGKGESYAVIPRHILYRYNAYDVACTWRLYERYTKELEEHGVRGLHDWLCEASGCLQRMEERGLGVDEQYLDYLTEHYLEGLGVLEQELSPWVRNPRSPQQVKRALEDLGLRAPDTTEDTLTRLLEGVLPAAAYQKLGDDNYDPKLNDAVRFLRGMLKHRTEQKLYGTYIKGTRKRLYRGRVHPTLMLHGTTTGRLACRNPNLQNVPRDSSIRQMFVPESGRVFVQADYATIELRVLATLARDEYLRGVFAEGRDIHNEVALQFFGEGFTKEQRVRAKAVVYGLSYGREAMSLALEYGIGVGEAQKYLNEFFQMIPQTAKWRRDLVHQIESTQDDLVSFFGRHRRFYLLTKDNKKDVIKESYAFFPQSTASDINIRAAMRLQRDHGLDLRLLVHDSILAEADEADAEEVGRLMSSVMSQVAKEEFSDFVPFPADVKIGKHWGEV